MPKDFKEQLKGAISNERKKLEEEALNKAEGMIKSLVYRDDPAHDSFREELKAKIMDARHAPLFMKLFQVKVLVPAMALVLLLSVAVGAYKIGAFDGAGASLAKFWPNYKAAQQPRSEQQTTDNNKPKNNEQVEIPNIEGGSKMFALSLVKPVFASFESTKQSVAAELSGERVDISSLSNLVDFEKAYGLTSAQKDALGQSNFFLTNNNFIGDQVNGTDDFNDTYMTLGGSQYEIYRSPENSVFVTSDYALHLYHILIDRSFQRIEEQKLQPRLKEMSDVLYWDSLEGFRSSQDPAIKDSYKRLSAYYLVALSILNAGVDAPVENLSPSDFDTFAQFEEARNKAANAAGEGKPDILGALEGFAGDIKDGDASWIYDTAKAELELIDKAEFYGPSPLFTPNRPEFKNDYTQFVPRSHYTKNKTLKSYFMAMMWYGRSGFVLKSPEQTRDALIITGQVNDLKVGDEKMSDLWADTMALIDFFVGETDDLTPFQYTDVAKKVFGDEMTDAQLASDDMMKAFKSEATKTLNGPKILSEVIMSEDVPGMTKEELLADTMQFRFMGQRFTPDAYILNQLTQGQEAPDKETGQSLPSMATALMPISVIEPNNSTVKGYFDQWVKTNAPDSDKIIAKTYDRLVGEVMNIPSEQWNSNIYWNWLDCYRSLLGGYDQGYPYFMKSSDWSKKSLGTVLGSYTELKHDTLLYAKQSYAELGAGWPDGEIPPVPKGYVEADPIFWNKILSLAKVTRQGLSDRGYMPEGFDMKYETFINEVAFFEDLSKKELKNENISDDDFEKLRLSGRVLQRVVDPVGGEVLTTKDRRAGIIADIHTDAVDSKILYEATGKPKLIYVAVSDVNGTRLVVGASYSQYEFAAPLKSRMTDEQWQSIVYEGEGQVPADSAWTKEITK